MNIRRSQISMMNIQYKYYPFKRFLDDAVKYGINNIEIWGAAPHFYVNDLTYTDIERMNMEIVSRGLSVACYTPEQCIYPINIAAERESERRRSIKYFEDQIRIAEELGADKMLVTSGWGYFDGSNYQSAWNYAKEGILDIAECASLHNVKIALEVLRKDESNLVNDLPSLTKMMREIDHDNLYAIMDTCPMSLNGRTPKDYLKTLGPKLLHIHFIDGMPGKHLAWGDGKLPLEKYLTELSDYNYQGFLSLEITDNRYFIDPEISVKRSMTELQKFIVE